MDDLVFCSKLTEEEIERNFEDFNLAESLEESLLEVLEHKKTQRLEKRLARQNTLPVVSPASLRTSLNMTQVNFANMLGVSSRTVEAWERGQSNPNPTAKKLMFLIREDSSLVKKLSATNSSTL